MSLSGRSAEWLFVSLLGLVLLVSGCRESLSPQERWDRIRQAESAGDWRLVRIEVKHLLAQSPRDAAAHLSLARAELALGNANLAEEEIRKAISLGLDDVETRLLLGKAWIAQGRYTRVLEALSPDAWGRDPVARSRILTLRGHAALAMSDLDRALSEYREAARLAPRLVEPRLGLARVYRNTGRLEAAEKLIRELEKSAADDARVWFEKAELLALRGEDEAAIEAYRKAVRFHDRDRDVLQVMIRSGFIQVLLKTGRQEEAREQVRWLKAHFPKQHITRYLHALMEYSQGRLEAAEESLRPLLSELPGNPRVNLLAGAVALARGNLEQANRHLELVLRKQPGNPVATRLIASVRMLLDQPEGVVEVLDPLVNKGVDDPWVYRLLVKASLGMGLYAEARQYIRELETRTPSDAKSTIELSRAYLLSGDAEAAARILGNLQSREGRLAGQAMEIVNLLAGGKLGQARKRLEAFRDAGGNPAIYHNLEGMLHALQGRFDEARGAFARASEMNPEDVSPRINLARLEEMAGRFSEARRIYQNILSMNPENVEVVISLARLEMQQGDVARALDLANQAVDIAPRSYQARLVLARLCLAVRNVRCALEAADRAQRLAVLARDRAGALFVKGRALLESGKGEDAAAALEEAIHLGLDQADVLSELGRAYMISGHLEEAEKAFGRILEKAPSHPEALGGMLQLAFRRNDPGAAGRWLDRLKRHHPDAVETRIFEASYLQWQGERQQARRVLENAWRKKPERRLLLALHEVMKAQGDRSRLELLQGWLKLHPDDVAVRHLLAEDALAMGRLRLAESEYARILKRHPNDPRALNNLAWIREELSQPGSLELARRAYRLLPDAPDVADTYGWILYRRGRLEEAVEELARAVRLSSGKDPEILRHYNEALDALSRARKGGVKQGLAEAP